MCSYLAIQLFMASLLVVIAGIVSAVGPFLKQNDIISLLILNVISIIILLILALVSPIYDLIEILVLIPISLIITISSAITFVDIWHFHWLTVMKMKTNMTILQV